MAERRAGSRPYRLCGYPFSVCKHANAVHRRAQPSLASPWTTHTHRLHAEQGESSHAEACVEEAGACLAPQTACVLARRACATESPCRDNETARVTAHVRAPNEHVVAATNSRCCHHEYLSCPATSASVERLFSIVGTAFSDKRQRGNASTIADIVFTKVNVA